MRCRRSSDGSCPDLRTWRRRACHRAPTRQGRTLSALSSWWMSSSPSTKGVCSSLHEGDRGEGGSDRWRGTRRDPFGRFGSLTGKLHADLLGNARELPGEDVRVAHLSQRRPEPFEVTPDVAHPHRIENDVEGTQVGAESTGGDSSLMDVLGRSIARGGTETPVVVQESGEALREHRRHHVTECRVRTELSAQPSRRRETPWLARVSESSRARVPLP